MDQYKERIELVSSGPGALDITAHVERVVRNSGLTEGLATLFVLHTSASLIVQENADPDVLRDLETFFLQTVSRHADWRHDAEGPDDMPAHIRNVLTATSLTIPVEAGRPVLGTWQSVYLYEHRDAPHRRQIVVHVMGS